MSKKRKYVYSYIVYAAMGGMPLKEGYVVASSVNEANKLAIAEYEKETTPEERLQKIGSLTGWAIPVTMVGLFTKVGAASERTTWKAVKEEFGDIPISLKGT